MTTRWAQLAAVFCVLSGLSGYLLAEGYIDRLPSHRGYYRVAVADAVTVPPLALPRHAVLVLIDGLRADHAVRMHSVERLRQAGQCRLTDVGPLSVSRPVYAVVATGMEQDRTGVRNNDCSQRLPVESIFQVAKRAGRRVYGVSELPWVQQLFPDGFDGFEVIPRSQDHFTRREAELGDLSLFLPIYVDESAHDFGAASAAYRESVARADAELSRLLSRIDLQRDLVVLTADHGHSDRGGHGARSPEVAQVLTCFAGFGVQRRDAEKGSSADATSPALLSSRSIAPAMAVLLGLPFPQHMRAGQDGLDVLLEIADPTTLGRDYLADRQAALARFRTQNRQAVATWLGRSGEADWSELYTRQAQRQQARGLAVLVACGLALGWLCRRQSWQIIVELVGFGLLSCAALIAIWIGLRGSFDFTSMNERADFIKWVIVASLLALAAMTALGRLQRRSWPDLALGLLLLLGLLDAVNLAHITAFGWPMGFPLPSPRLLFVPFIAGSFQAVVAVAALLSLGAGWRRRQAGSGRLAAAPVPTAAKPSP